MNKILERDMKCKYIEFDYRAMYSTPNYLSDIVDETNLVIDEKSYQNFLYTSSPFYKKGYLKKGYIEAPLSFLINTKKFLNGVGRIKLNNELYTIYTNLNLQTDKLCSTYKNEAQLEQTPYEVIGVYFKGNIRASRVFRKYDFQAPKNYFSNILRFASMLEHIELNTVVKNFNNNIRQETLQIITDREKIFKKIRKNLINYIFNSNFNSALSSNNSINDIITYENEIKKRCITILIII